MEKTLPQTSTLYCHQNQPTQKVRIKMWRVQCCFSWRGWASRNFISGMVRCVWRGCGGGRKNAETQAQCKALQHLVGTCCALYDLGSVTLAVRYYPNSRMELLVCLSWIWWCKGCKCIMVCEIGLENSCTDEITLQALDPLKNLQFQGVPKIQ